MHNSARSTFTVLSSVTLRDGVVAGAGYGHWFPGRFWRAATPGAAENFAYTQITYRF